MTPSFSTRRDAGVDDAMLEAIAHRDVPTDAEGDPAARLLVDLAAAADAATPGIDASSLMGGPRTAPWPPERARSPVSWAAAAAAATVAALAVGLGAVASRPPSPQPVTTVEATPVSLTRARTLITEAKGLLHQGSSHATRTDVARAKGLLDEARLELKRAGDAQEGRQGEREDVAGALSQAEVALTSAEQGLDRDEGTIAPTNPHEDEHEDDAVGSDGADEPSEADSGTEDPADDSSSESR